ncbi:nucleic acid-binding protein [Candidatus Thiomargarita nelsonii]|uniref:Nucleic acid-binding protein n=1 Tax=Candidatus Thiomargarita nelsonii TaxID=1003181 RepID=A0A176S3H9_9GAMM|nr:nucleic acid-binding protein [Candidatus Thiomargarita nelsonii]
MGTERLSVISDAGPLIHLVEIDSRNDLSMFENLHIPEAVWSETVGLGRIQSEEIVNLGNIQRHTLPQSESSQFIANHNLKEIHDGERECLYLCRQIEVATLLTDDLAVRKAAKSLNLIPVGSLGIIAKAYHQGLISVDAAEKHLLNLYDESTLFVTKAIVELAIKQLHQDAQNVESSSR